MAPAARGGRRSPLPNSSRRMLLDLLRLCDSRVRVEILFALAGRSMGAAALASLLGTGVPTVSRHLRLLHDAGMVQATRHSGRRVYSLGAGVRVRPRTRRIVIETRATDGSTLSMGVWTAGSGLGAL